MIFIYIAVFQAGDALQQLKTEMTILDFLMINL